MIPTLDQAMVSALPHSGPEDNARKAGPLAGLTVLLVEDSRYVSDAVRLMCGRLGARLRRTATLEQAKIHVRTYRPDVMIIDLGLPDGRGEELIEQATQMPKPPVILGLSGEPAGRARALEAGAVGFLDKPIATLADFQQIILEHIPSESSSSPSKETSPHADPIALRDDFARALNLLQANTQSRGYLLAFIAGLARTTFDNLLLETVQKTVIDEGHTPILEEMLRERLSKNTLI